MMAVDFKKEEFIIGPNTAQSNEELVMTYQNNIRMYGFNSKTLLYVSENLHEAKLEQYRKILLKTLDSRDSMLDIGCGYGSLVERLKGPLAQCKYHGIDIVSEFIEEARSKHKSLYVTFKKMDLEQYPAKEDWCILLGVVNSVPEPKKLIQLAWDKSRKGLIVDFNDIDSPCHVRYNKFDIDEQKKYLRKLGAVDIEEYKEIPIWKTLVAKK